MRTFVASLLLGFCCTTAYAAEPAPGVDIVKGVAINVSDLERSTKFYTEILGLKVASVVPPGPVKGARETVLNISGQFDLGPTTVLVLAHLDDKPLPADRAAFGRLLFIAKNAAAVAAHARAAGYTVRETGHTTFISDPDGYQVALTVPIALPKQ